MKVYAVWSIDYYDGKYDTNVELLKIFDAKEKAIEYIIKQINEDTYFEGVALPDNARKLVEENNRIYFSDETRQFVEDLLLGWENGVEFYIEEWEVE